MHSVGISQPLISPRLRYCVPSLPKTWFLDLLLSSERRQGACGTDVERSGSSSISMQRDSLLDSEPCPTPKICHQLIVVWMRSVLLDIQEHSPHPYDDELR